MGSDLGSRRLCAEKYVTVMSTVPSCDVTTVQLHYEGSTSTPPRVARAVSDSRGVAHCTEKNSQIYACPHESIVRRVQSIIFVSRDIHSYSSPLYHLPGELVSLSSVPMPSIDLNLWNRSRPSAFVPMSLGFTSVLTDDIVKKFPKYQILNKNLVCMCFILRLAPCFVATARAVLLSAHACVRNDSPISFSVACASIQLTVHQGHTFLILHRTRQQSPVLDIHSSREIDQRNTVCKMCFFLVTGSAAQSAAEYPVMCFKVLFKSFCFNAGIVK